MILSEDIADRVAYFMISVFTSYCLPHVLIVHYVWGELFTQIFGSLYLHGSRGVKREVMAKRLMFGVHE
jgi:hypothetical protein